MRRRGESRTDWKKADATTEAELEASIAADPDDVRELDWTHAVIGLPPRKQDIHIRLDENVLSWFKRSGKGYQTRINSVLRAFVQSRLGQKPASTIPKRGVARSGRASSSRAEIVKRGAEQHEPERQGRGRIYVEAHDHDVDGAMNRAVRHPQYDEGPRRIEIERIDLIGDEQI